MVPFSVSALHHRYCSLFFLTAFSLYILQGNLDVLWYDSHTLGMYGVEVRQYHFLLCFPFVSSPLTLPEMTHYHIDVFHFFLHYLLPHASFHPHFIDLISCFSHLDLCSDKLVVFGVFTFWAVPVCHSYSLDLLLQLTCFIHINLIFFSISVCMLFCCAHIFFYIFLVLMNL